MSLLSDKGFRWFLWPYLLGVISGAIGMFQVLSYWKVWQR